MSPFSRHLARCIDDAWALMEEIGRRTAGPPPGITRDAFGAGEQIAMEMVAAFAVARDLTVEQDGFGNHHAVLPGTDAAAPAVAAGSHVDSVPNGGNFDGLAGCVAALAVLVAAKEAGVRTRRPLRALAMRGEESPWFGTAYLGSRLMLGLSPWSEIGGLRRRDTGRALADHLAALGYAPDAATAWDPAGFACFLELHIEQGPLLEGEGVPLGIATACRGNIRFPQARCHGAYGHSAALPRAYRRDAVLAVADLALTLDAFWAERLAAGDDNFVATVGQFCTDPEQHAMTKIGGEVAFTLNIGATDPATLEAARTLLQQAVARIERERRVVFELGGEVGTAPVPLHPGLQALLEDGAASAGIATLRMPTVGHDAAMFAQSGVPAAVLLVRNAHGSHNPEETMEQSDFALGVQVLAAAMMRAADNDAAP
ncbi:MAG: Zn-dependent hydrolase [Janthinobacterium lividum]